MSADSDEPASAAGASSLYGTDNALHTVWTPGSDVILFVFNGMPIAHTEWVPFQYVKTTEEFGVNRVFIRDTRRAWYHFGLSPFTTAIDDTAAFLCDIAVERKARRIVMIGSSAGGYAAMLFGRLIGADEVHAFAPQTYLDIENRLKNDDFYMDHYTPPLYETPGVQSEYFDLRPLLNAPGAATDYYLHYSKSFYIDVFHADHVRGAPGLFFRQHEDGTHNIAKYLRDAGLLTGILRDAVEGRTERRDLEYRPGAA